jgi:hypothetical protein
VGAEGPSLLRPLPSETPLLLLLLLLLRAQQWGIFKVRQEIIKRVGVGTATLSIASSSSSSGSDGKVVVSSPHGGGCFCTSEQGGIIIDCCCCCCISSTLRALTLPPAPLLLLLLLLLGLPCIQNGISSPQAFLLLLLPHVGPSRFRQGPGRPQPPRVSPAATAKASRHPTYHPLLGPPVH